MKNEEDLNRNSIVNKDMGLFGRGRGPFGIPIAYTSLFIILLIIWLMFLSVAIFLFIIRQFLAGFMSIASAIMFTGFILTLFGVFAKKR